MVHIFIMPAFILVLACIFKTVKELIKLNNLFIDYERSSTSAD